MAVVTEAEKQILLQMGFAEFIIPAMSQVTAQMAIDEFHNTGVPPGLSPGQLGTTAGGGILDQISAGAEGFTDEITERVNTVVETVSSVAETVTSPVFGTFLVIALVAVAVIVVAK